MRKSKCLCVIMSIVVILFHLHTLKVMAVELSKTDTSGFLNAVHSVEHNDGNKREFFGFVFDDSNFHGSNYIGAFEITDLDKPEQGKLLDIRATVIADNGIFWEIPVIWVDKDGNEISLHLDVRKSYPVFIFFVPEGYSIKKSTFGDFNIALPDFLSEVLCTNGMLSLADPSKGLIYFTTRLGGSNATNNESIQISTSDFSSNDETLENTEQFVENLAWLNEPIRENQNIEAQNDVNNSESGSSQNRKDFITPITNGNSNSGIETDPKDIDSVTPSDVSDIVLMHCDQNAIATIGYDELEWLVRLVKYNIEPQAVNLLLERFPAYRTAANNNELGKNIGLYVYYNDYTDSQGSISNKADAIAGVAGKNNGDTYSYRIVLNASKVLDYDANTNTYSHDEDNARKTLDNTILHELMHSFMYDYTRPGMTGEQYNSTIEETVVNSSSSEIYNDVKYPTWFVEGIASTVENSVQEYRDIIRSAYGYDSETDNYDYGLLQNRYVIDNTLHLNYSDNSQLDQTDIIKSAYVSGYLANVYLGYLAALKYDEVDAIEGDTTSGDYIINSNVICSGVNHILEQLHSGQTLDEVIANISKIDDTKSLYNSTDDFALKFIYGNGYSDSGQSQEFVLNFLNYIESVSTDNATVNGSILLDFTDTTQSPLKPENNESAPGYVPSDTKDFVDSTVSNEDALRAGGCSESGITQGSPNNSNDEVNSGGNNSNDEINSGGSNSNDETNTGGNNSNDETHSGYNANDEFHIPGSRRFGGFDEFHILKVDSSSLNKNVESQLDDDAQGERDEGIFDSAEQDSNVIEPLEEDFLVQVVSTDLAEFNADELALAETGLLEETSYLNDNTESQLGDKQGEMNEGALNSVESDSNVIEPLEEDSLVQVVSTDLAEFNADELALAETDLLEEITTEVEGISQYIIEDTLNALANAEYLSGDDTANADDNANEREANEDAIVNSNDDGAGKGDDVSEDGNCESNPEGN